MSKCSKGVLAWLLSGKGRVISGVIGDVVDHRDNIGLGVYQKEVTKGEHNK